MLTGSQAVIGRLQKSNPEISRKTSRPASADNSPFKQAIGQLETLIFVGAGVEDHQRTRTETSDLADRVPANPTPLV
jgi:hypothetical protein